MNRSILYIRCIVVAMVLLLSVSCTQDVIEGVRVKLIPSELYGGVEQTLQTKAEAGYYDYVPNVGLTMGVYAAGGSNETVQGTFTYTENGWDSDLTLEAGKQYNLFVYSPKMESASFNGANVLVLNNLSVSSDDMVVIEGVASPNNPIQVGNFSYTMTTTPQGTNPKDYIDIKMDHLFAQIFLEFAIEDAGNDPFKFGNLRKIEITKAEIGSVSSSNATITFNNGNSSNPFTVSWSNMQSSQQKNYAEMQQVAEVANAGGLMLMPDPQYKPYGGAFVIPTINGNMAEMWLRVTYNVYDLNGTLVREGDVSENRLSISSADMVRGTIYKKKIYVQPTYIYSLTDGDQLTLKF